MDWLTQLFGQRPDDFGRLLQPMQPPAPAPQPEPALPMFAQPVPGLPLGAQQLPPGLLEARPFSGGNQDGASLLQQPPAAPRAPEAPKPEPAALAIAPQPAPAPQAAPQPEAVPLPPARPAGIGGGPEETPPARPADLPAPNAQPAGLAPAAAPAPAAPSLPQPLAGVAPMGRPTGSVSGPSSLLSGLLGGGQKKSGSLLSNPMFMMGLGLLSGKTLSEGFQNAMHGLIAAQPYVDKEKDREYQAGVGQQLAGLNLGGSSSSDPQFASPSGGSSGASAPAGPTVNLGANGAATGGDGWLPPGAKGLANAAIRGHGAMPSAQMLPSGVRIAQKLVAGGIDPKVAAAVAGQFGVESRFNPAENRGDGGTAMGLAQWRNERFSALQALARQRGTSWQDEDTQVAHIINELKGSEAGAYKAALAAPDASAAAYAIAKNYERPSTRALAQSSPARQAMAAKIYANLGQGGTQTAAASPVPAAAGQVASTNPTIVPNPFNASAAPVVGSRPSLGVTAPAVNGAVPAPSKTTPVGQTSQNSEDDSGDETPAPAPQPVGQVAPATPATDPVAAQKQGWQKIRSAPQQGTLAADAQKKLMLIASDPRSGAQNQALAKMLLERGQKQEGYSLWQSPDGDMVNMSNVTGQMTMLKQGKGQLSQPFSYQGGIAQRGPDGEIKWVVNPKDAKDDKKTAAINEFEYAQGHPGFVDYQTKQGEAKAQRTTINNAVNPIIKGLGEQFTEQRSGAQDAANAIQAVRTARQQLDAPGGIVNGQFADERLALQKMGALFGADPSTIQNTETFAAAIKPLVLSTVKGLGAGSGISNADRDFALAAAGGSIKLDAGSIRRILDITERAAQAKVAAHNALADQMLETQPELKQLAPMLRVQMPAATQPLAPAAPAQPVTINGYQIRRIN